MSSSLVLSPEEILMEKLEAAFLTISGEKTEILQAVSDFHNDISELADQGSGRLLQDDLARLDCTKPIVLAAFSLAKWLGDWRQTLTREETRKNEDRKAEKGPEKNQGSCQEA